MSKSSRWAQWVRDTKEPTGFDFGPLGAPVFARDRMRGEWFRRSATLSRFIAALSTSRGQQ